MAIDVDQAPQVGADGVPVVDVESAGWWVVRLQRQLSDHDRQQRLDQLDAWWRGCPPLPRGAHGSEAAYRDFQEHARTNLYSLVCEAVRQRMQLAGVRTSADADGDGDQVAWQLMRRTGMLRVAPEVHSTMLRLGACPVLVGPPRAGSRWPTVTAEDPRQIAWELDPISGDPVAGLKVFRDDYSGRGVGYLYRPGRVDCVRSDDEVGQRTAPTVDPRSWSWDEEASGPLPDGVMALTVHQNAGGLAEPEPHLDLLRRIDRQILQRLTIAALQAFRQRYVEGGLPRVDEQGRTIDWDDILSAAPGALWSLPKGSSLRELGQVDLTPILSAVREDIKLLAAVSLTPMSMLDPGGENQSAEGAALAKEGLVFKARDRTAGAAPSWHRVISAAMVMAPDDVRYADVDGERVDRADLDQISVIWAPPERQSLAERASAAAQAAAAGVPWATRMRDIMGYAPDQIAMMRAERDDDQLLAAQQAAVLAQGSGD